MPRAALKPARPQTVALSHARALGLVIPLLATPALAGGGEGLEGAGLGLVWVAPFAGLLLSIALVPLLAPRLWHRHFGKIAAAWALAFLLPALARFGPAPTLEAVLHVLARDYLPFMILIATLYIIAGGVRLQGVLRATPTLNTGILALGALLASLMGTTGAAMLTIRPLLRANRHRRSAAHVVIFFIFLVANIGGALTPLGDPPIFLGFLQGVEFFWTLRHLAAPTGFAVLVLLALFFLIDCWHFRREPPPAAAEPSEDPASEGPGGRLRLEGGANLWLLAAVVGVVLLQGVWTPDAAVPVLGVPIPLEVLTANTLLVALAGLSLHLGSVATRRQPHTPALTWTPVQEVAKVFGAIFITLIPAIAILRAGPEGALSGVFSLVTEGGRPVNGMYFWVTGLLSGFLDNAPTYLIFFNAAGGDAGRLMTEGATTLAAISAGAVFMGANSYIGNAPNFMVKAIAEDHGVRMPGFFGYMVWSGLVLMPLFVLETLLFFR
jgi:Na+/H+ antiporter NhaD/arsenite permease-like protein